MPYRDELLLDDPQTTREELQRIAGQRPDLRAKVAAHPNAYPELLEWLSRQGDPMVDAALEARNRPRPTIGLPMDVVMPTSAPSYGSAPSQPSAGYAQPSAPSAPAVAYGQPPRRDNGFSGPIIAIIVLLLCIIAALIFLWLRAQAAQTDAEPAPSVVTTTAPVSEPPAADPTDEPSDESADASEDPTDDPTEDPTEEETEEESELPGPYVPAGDPVSKVAAPSGNIACLAGNDGSFDCTILQRNFEMAECPAGPVSVHVSADGQVSMSCGEVVSQGGTVVGYGQTVPLGESGGCTSTEQGMRCWSGTNNEGVNIARAGVTAITGP